MANNIRTKLVEDQTYRSFFSSSSKRVFLPRNLTYTCYVYMSCIFNVNARCGYINNLIIKHRIRKGCNFLEFNFQFQSTATENTKNRVGKQPSQKMFLVLVYLTSKIGSSEIIRVFDLITHETVPLLLGER